MAEWEGLNAQFVTKLRDEKIEDVPEQIVKLAQASLDGQPKPDDPGVLMHAMQFTFTSEPTDAENVAKATAFAKHMRNAGAHTKPPSSITVLQDPERVKVQATENGEPLFRDGKPVMVPGPAVNPAKVAWRAGARRGRVAGT
jgi:hypothetical protein